MTEIQQYMRHAKRWSVALLLVTSLWSCKSDYERYVDQEMASGNTADSLILGMHIGQTREDFYEICWNLNKQGLLSDASGKALYKMDLDSSGSNPDSKDMLFYGIFDEEDVMRGMDISYSYAGWAPWNRAFHSDSLMFVLRERYEQGYTGNDFLEVEVPGLELPALVKIDGYRQILMYPKSDKDVVVMIEDLRYKLKK